MLKKMLLLTIGGTVFVIGMILFPLPIPFGLPTMVLGVALMFKASNKVKRITLRCLDKNQHSRKLWQRIRVYRSRKKPVIKT